MGIKKFFSNMYSVKNSVSINPSTFQGFDVFGGSFAGVRVNTKSAMQHEMVYACIRDKAESIGQLDVRLYKMKGGVKHEQVLDNNNREYKIFVKNPNSFMTMQDLKENYVTCMEANGRYLAYVLRNKYGKVVEIIPFRNQQNVGVDMDMNGNIYYTYTTNDNKPAMSFSGENIMHIKLNTLDGFTGLSPIKAGARAIGINISQQEHMGALMENGASLRGILTTEAIFSDETVAERVRKDWKSFQGSKGSGKTPVLENGLKYQSMSISPADSELLLQMNYGRESICLLFGVPLERFGIGQNSKATPQEVSVNYLKRLNPLIVKFETAISDLAPDNMIIECDRRGFIKGDPQAQAKTVEAEMKMGLISINEGREDMGRMAKEGGGVHAIQTNNITFGELDQILEIQEQNRLANNQKKPAESTSTEEDENQ